jgi:hypothetical protein
METSKEVDESNHLQNHLTEEEQMEGLNNV